MPGRQQLDLGATSDEPFARIKYFNAMSPVRRNHSNPDQRPSMELQMPSLSSRHLKPPPQLSHNRPHHRPLLLQRMNIPKKQIQSKLPNKQLSSPGPFCNPDSNAKPKTQNPQQRRRGSAGAEAAFPQSS